VPLAGKIEEENLPWYKPDQSYPVRIGDVFRSPVQSNREAWLRCILYGLVM
jgi:hypothetical protein